MRTGSGICAERGRRAGETALQLSIPCFTSLDTANALADIIGSRFTQQNTELVDLNHMRTTRQTLPFAKLQGTGDDYIFFENFDGAITCPESLAVRLCHRHYGIGGDGVVLLERSQVADIRMRIFNQDGSEGKMAGNSIRGAAKLAHDRGYVTGGEITVETASGIKHLHLYLRGGKRVPKAPDPEQE